MYRPYVILPCQEYKQLATFVYDLGNMPTMRLPIDEISAVLWSPEEQTDEEGDHEYTLLVGDQTYAVFSKRNAKEFLTFLFDYRNPERDIYKRLPAENLRHDFVTMPQLRCVVHLKFTPCHLCCIALLPKHVQGIFGQDSANECAVTLRGRKHPIRVQLGEQSTMQFSKWIFDPE